LPIGCRQARHMWLCNGEWSRFEGIRSFGGWEDEFMMRYGLSGMADAVRM